MSSPPLPTAPTGHHARSEVIVIGAGVVGLTTACVLGARGCRVRVWTRDDPLQTVSAVAGAIWYPFLAEPRERVLAWCAHTFQVLRGLAGEPMSGVRMQSVVEVFTVPEPDLWWAPAAAAIERLPAAQVPKPYAAAIRLDVPVCDAPQHLAWLQADLLARGGRLERRTVDNFAEALDEAPMVVNCTGLGAAALCADRELYAVRGQVVVVERRPIEHAWIDDNGAQPFYVVPRAQELVLGGTAQRGDLRREVDEADTAAILGGMAQRLPELAGVPVRRVATGLRPCRPAVRLELDAQAGRRLVHNYGHGGSGYTLAWGCADEVADLLGFGPFGLGPT